MANEKKSKKVVSLRTISELSGNMLVSKPLVLLLDDDYDFALFVERRLKETVRLDYAPDGFSAFHMIKRTNYDVILCDIHMPYVSGLAFLDELHHRKIDVPLIFISRNISEQEMTDALRKGAFNVLHKPFTIEELMSKIHLAIQLNQNNQVMQTQGQEKAHIYNQLKTYYYDIQDIIHWIQYYNISLNVVEKELEIKHRSGKCIFDDVKNLKKFKSA